MLNSTEATYDVETLTKAKNIVSVWIHYEEKHGTSDKVLTEIDCLRNQIRSVRSISYFRNGDVRRQNDSAGNWNGPIPGSNGESYLKIFCKDEHDYQYLQDWNHRNDLITKGSALMDAKEYDAAIVVYSDLIEGFQESAGYGFAMIGQAMLNQGKLREATNALLEAVKLEPESYYYFLILGEVYEKHNDYDRAKEAYWKSMRLDKGKFMSAEYKLLKIYEKENDGRGRLKVYGYLVSRGELHNYKYIGDLCEKLGLRAEARTYRLSGVRRLEQNIRNNKAEFMDFSSLASIYKSLGQPVKERSTLLRGVQRFPKEAYLAQRLAEYYNGSKQWRESIQVIKAVLPTEDKFQRYLLLKALKVAYEGLGETAEAAKVEAQLKQN